MRRALRAWLQRKLAEQPRPYTTVRKTLPATRETCRRLITQGSGAACPKRRRNLAPFPPSLSSRGRREPAGAGKRGLEPLPVFSRETSRPRVPPFPPPFPGGCCRCSRRPPASAPVAAVAAGSMAAVEARVCETAGCSSEAKLQCPTCIKLGIQGSYFCSQECFKGSWATHKLLHKKAKDEKAKREVSAWTIDGDINTDPWAGYRYTGKLRPHYPLMPMRPVPSYIQRPDYADHPLGMSESEQTLKGTSQIKILSSEDIEGMRVVCRLAREVLDVAAMMVKPGVTTEEIDHAVHLACIARNCYPSPLNYYNFPKSCCTSVNEVICHGIPDRRRLQEGDIVNVDITVYRNGYHGDLNETFYVGEVDEGAKRLVQTTYECLMQAIDAVKPGVRYRELGNIIQKHAQANGFSVVRSYCGHGIHKLFHTAPNVPHYAKNKAVGVMKPGHAFTIEPMICEGGWQDETWPDGWTAVTRDGKRSAQFEHTLLVTDTGCDILTRRLDSIRPHFMTQC